MAQKALAFSRSACSMFLHLACHEEREGGTLGPEARHREDIVHLQLESHFSVGTTQPHLLNQSVHMLQGTALTLTLVFSIRLSDTF